jgi:hypothetical protein
MILAMPESRRTIEVPVPVPVPVRVPMPTQYFM